MNGPANHSRHKLMYSTVANVYVLEGFAKPYWYIKKPTYATLKLIILN